MVADPDPGKSEGGDSREVRRVGGGGGWAEDMEGRSVLSLTLVYIIFFDCSRQPASQNQPASQLLLRPRPPQVRFFHYHKRVRELSAFPVRFFLDLEKS
jgi:hypothetical protein